MPERLHPGVYVEEVSSGVRPIEGVSTSTAAFLGKAEMGTLNKAVLITGAQEFTSLYGGFLSDSFLAHSVLQFYNNGGKKCYIVRVAGAGATAASIAIKDRRGGAAAKTITIGAASEGVWGNKLDLVITDGTADPDNEFAIQVFQDRSELSPPKPPLLLETLDNLSMNRNAPNYVEKVVSGISKYLAATVEAPNLANSGNAVSRGGKLQVGNGAAALQLTIASGATETAGTSGATPTAGRTQSGATPNVNPNADQRKFRININGDGPREITLPTEVQGGANIAAAIQEAVRALNPLLPTTNREAYTGFTATFPGPHFLLTSGTLGTTSTVQVTNAVDSLGTALAAVSLPPGTYNLVIFINEDGPHPVTVTVPAGPAFGPADIVTALQGAIQGLTAKRASNTAAINTATVSYENTNADAGNPAFVVTSLKANAAPGIIPSVRILSGAPAAQNLAALLKLGKTNVGSREISGAAVLRPANSPDPTPYHLGDAVAAGNVDSFIAGADGALPGPNEYRDGLTALDVVRDVNIVCIPGDGSIPVVDLGTNYCGLRADCFFIGDTNRTDDTVAEAQAFVNGLSVKNSYGAVYYPWLLMGDPTGLSPEPIPVPPSGFVAGLYARTDSRRGVWKAPAGTEANIGGAIGMLADTTDVQQDFLNPIGVNVIRFFPAAGRVIWGARTLATKSDPEWRYVPVRRMAIFLEQSIYNGIQYAVFEPNDEPLWATLRLNIGAFMMLQFRAGAFQGRTPNDAFFVQCDSKTTTQADIDAGVVNILVGFAPLKPAEFVVLKLSQKVNQPAA